MVRIKHLRRRAAAILVFLASGFLGAQEASPSPPPAVAPKLHDGFGDIILGMPYQEAYRKIQESPDLMYRGKPDVSLSPSREDRIIETRGGYFVRRGIFQFRDDKLFSIILEMEPSRMDYYLLFDSLGKKYGPPADLDPGKAVWDDGTTLMVLEKPQTLKYLVKSVLDGISSSAQVEKTLREESREMFIDGL